MKRFAIVLMILTTWSIPAEGWSQKPEGLGSNGAAGSKRKGPAIRDRRGTPEDFPRVGSVAAEFRLKSPDGDRVESLEELRAEKPVVLLFGSYT